LYVALESLQRSVNTYGPTLLVVYAGTQQTVLNIATSEHKTTSYLAMAGFHGTLSRCWTMAETGMVTTRYHLNRPRACDTAACDVALFTA